MKTDYYRGILSWTVVAVAVLSSTASALTVNTTTDELDSPAGTAVSLREAIRDTPPGGTIDFDSSLSGKVIQLTLGELAVSKDLTIDASSLSHNVIIDGVHSSRILRIVGVTVSISQLTLRNGYAPDRGGALHISSSADVTLTDCTLTRNTSELLGGAVFSDASVLTVNNSRIHHNTIRSGSGGAIAINAASTLAMSNSSVSYNVSSDHGGAIFSTSANSVTLRRCTVHNNAAENGAGIYALNTSLSIASSTLVENRAGSNAGGIYATGNLDIDSSTIVANHANITGGGIILGGSPSRSMRNSIVAANQSKAGPDILISSGTLTSAGGNFIGSNNGCATHFPEGSPNGNNDYVGSDTATLNPLLSPLALFGGSTETMHPLSGSPVINSGVTTSLTTDQRGFLRSNGTAADIGAVETGVVLTVTTEIDENDGSLGQGTGDSLRECIQAATGAGEHLQFSDELSGRTILLNNQHIEIAAKSLFVDASSLPENIAIDAHLDSRILLLNSGSSFAMHSVNMIRGSIHGIPVASGGCIESNTSQLTIIDSIMSDNSVSGTAGSFGGAVYINLGNLTMVDCTVSHNSAQSASRDVRGGGVALSNRSLGRFTRCRFESNELSDSPESHGAGLYISGEALVQDCTFFNNRAGADVIATGGGIRISGILTMENSSFSNNSAVSATGTGTGHGGAVALLTSSILHVTNCTFTQNTAESDGGAIHSQGQSNIIYSTVARNTATNGVGGGIRIASDTVHLENNIIAQNLAGSSGADISKLGLASLTSAGANLIGDNDTIAATFPAGPLSGTIASPVDPLLGSLGDYGGQTRTLPLTPGSPALNAATPIPNNPNTNRPITDQRHYPRTIGASADLGAYEAGNPAGYAAWAAEKIHSSQDAGFTADPESDRLKNGLEYATGRDPAATEGNDLLSLKRVAQAAGGYAMHITFPYKPTAPDVQYIIQRSTHLTAFSNRYHFTPSTASEWSHPGGMVTATRDESARTITVVDDGLASGPHYFWRLVVVKLP